MTKNQNKTIKEEVKQLIEDIMQSGFEVSMIGFFDKSPEENKRLQEKEYNKLVEFYSQQIIDEFFYKTLQCFIEETNPKKESLNSGNFRWVDYYNEFVEELNQKQQQWLKKIYEEKPKENN